MRIYVFLHKRLPGPLGRLLLQCHVIEMARLSPRVLTASSKVSAGYTHSCCLTTEGELYTWGNNQDGCLGHAPVLKFVDHPKVTDRKIYFSNLFGNRTIITFPYCGVGGHTTKSEPSPSFPRNPVEFRRVQTISVKFRGILSCRILSSSDDFH